MEILCCAAWVVLSFCAPWIFDTMADRLRFPIGNGHRVYVTQKTLNLGISANSTPARVATMSGLE